MAASAKATYSVLRRPARARTSSGSFGSCQARGAGSAHRLKSHAVQARPRQGCTPLQVGVPAATRRWRAAQQPKLRVLPLVVAQVPPGPVAQRAGGARWLPRRQIGRRRQHRQQPSGSGRGRAQGTSDGVCAAQRCRLTSPGDGADDGGVYGLLRAMPESKSVRDDLDAAVVSNRHIDIHVGQADITRAPASWQTLAAARPKREGPGGEHAGSCAGSPVIAEWVEAHGRRTYAGRPAVADEAGAASGRGTRAKSPSVQRRWERR